MQWLSITLGLQAPVKQLLTELALGPVMKCESLAFYNMDTKNPRTPDSIPYLQVRISHGVIWSPSQISLEAIVDAMNPGDFPMAMVVIQGLPELGV